MVRRHGAHCVEEQFLTVTGYIKIAIVLGVVSVAVVFGLVLRLLELPDASAPSFGVKSARTLATATGEVPSAAATVSPSATPVVGVANAYPNVHTTSGLASPRIGTLSRGERAEVIGRTADFCLARNSLRWVSKWYRLGVRRSYDDAPRCSRACRAGTVMDSRECLLRPRCFQTPWPASASGHKDGRHG